MSVAITLKFSAKWTLVLRSKMLGRKQAEMDAGNHFWHSAY